ncbi:DUF3021 domain-containing protein [Ectobacillus polymachus]|uniref:DUF3021 domain-containing protein n=1 Tax=Ectobacillus polymachus TaxID=1508806 RepID=UPI003A890B4D
MLKKALLRGLIGIPIGVFISSTIVLISSLVAGHMAYSATMDPSKNPVTVYAIQYVVSIIIGFTFASSSILFDLDNWSLAKMTTVHFLILSIVYLPCAIFAGWMKPDPLSIFNYFLIFVAIYILIWLSQYYIWKYRINKLNDTLNKRN